LSPQGGRSEKDCYRSDDRERTCAALNILK
jgi:hypothetical protein